MYEAYPLQWPTGYKKTPPGDRITSQFNQTMDKAQQFLRKEIERLEAIDLIISTNIPVRKNGLLYADMMKEKIDDPGVAIYFKHKGKERSMCCDQYLRAWENIYALGKGIEALRGIERWGISEFLDRAFTGFPALPESSTANQKIYWEILGLDGEPASSLVIRSAYRIKAKRLHPDAGGSADQWALLQEAYKQLLLPFNERP
jgi:hypothetical protein